MDRTPHLPGWQGYADRMAAAHGLRPTRANHQWPCPRVAAGGRCRTGTPRERFDPCLCRLHRAGLLERDRFWRDADGAYVLTAEPTRDRELTRHLRAFNAAVAPLGLEAVIRPGEQWYPGQTALVWVQGVVPARLRNRDAA